MHKVIINMKENDSFIMHLCTHTHICIYKVVLKFIHIVYGILFDFVSFYSLEDYVLPSHISYFMPGYLWLKILSKSINAFKKVKETLPFAIEILHKLINQNFYMQRKKEAWYAELALIEMYHNRNLEASAKITLESLKMENLSEVGTAELVERAKKLVKRKTGISNTTLANIKITLKFMESNFTSPILNTTVEATLMKG